MSRKNGQPFKSSMLPSRGSGAVVQLYALPEKRLGRGVSPHTAADRWARARREAHARGKPPAGAKPGPGRDPLAGGLFSVTGIY